VRGPVDKELHRFETPAGERLIHVTTVTGMAGVPLRFLMPPPIDILTVHLPERKKPRRTTGAFELVQRNPDQPASVWDLVACT
jgi:hypothetical protein